MSTDLFKLTKEGRVLLGITGPASATLNGKASFLDGIVENPSVDDLVKEMEKTLKIAKNLGFCDFICCWSVQYIMKGEREYKITEHRQLPLLRIAEICGKLNIYFSFIYCEENNTELDRNLVKELQKRSRGYFLGECLGEVGGRTWYTEERVRQREEAQAKKKPRFIRYKWYARDMQEAKDNYVNYIRHRVAKYKNMGCPLSFPVDSTAIQKYNLEGGIDFAGLESTHDLVRGMAWTRGASKSYGKDFWCAYIPLGYFWGWPHTSPAKFERWKVALDLSFMMGAGLIMNENGLFNTPINMSTVVPSASGLSGVYGFKSKVCAKNRKIFQDFARFTHLHRRPQEHPESNIAIIQGNLDGWNNCTSPGQKVWAQHKGGHWELGPAEESWKHLDLFLPGGYWLSGTPYGQIDIISSDATTSLMKQYKLLIFLGWNTMTENLLKKLAGYVASGGKVFMALPHLSTKVDREEDLKLINKKLQREIFGIEVKGKAKLIKKINHIDQEVLPGMKREYKLIKSRIFGAEIQSYGAKAIAYADEKPILIQNNLGKGQIYLLLGWNYPGEKGFDGFLKDLLPALAKDTLRAQKIKVEGGPALNYAIYPARGKRPKTLYVLEYDPKIDEYPQGDPWHRPRTWPFGNQTIKKKCLIKIGNREFSLKLKTNELRAVYLLDGLAISPSSKYVFLKRYKHTDNRHEITLQGEGATEVIIFSIKDEIAQVAVGGGRGLLKAKRLNNCLKFSPRLNAKEDYRFIIQGKRT